MKLEIGQVKTCLFFCASLDCKMSNINRSVLLAKRYGFTGQAIRFYWPSDTVLTDERTRFTKIERSLRPVGLRN